MQVIQFDEGVEIQLPDDLELVTPPAVRTGTRGNIRFAGVVPMPAEPFPEYGEDLVVNSLRDGDMELIKMVEIGPKAGSGFNRSAQGFEPGKPVAVNVNLQQEEDAVVLLEQDGMYSWKYPDEREAASGNRSRGGSSVATEKKLVFYIEADDTTPDASTKRNIFGQVAKFGLGIVKAYILKFVAAKSVSLAMSLLEKEIKPGLISIPSVSPAKWKPVDSLVDLDLPEDREAKILLFVHGTFSSTVSAFGALGGTPWGDSMLNACLENYDAVVGFNHFTLKQDPFENAQELLGLFLSYKGQPIIADIITHSRGGLVVRSLTEKLLPTQTESILRVNRVIFVGSTNGGTLLAEPENWETLIDLYTNLVAGSFRVIGLISPQTKLITTIVSEVIKNIGSFVKYCAVAAISDRLMPGLSAMEPDGTFIRDINAKQDKQPGVEQSNYCVISSDFKPSLSGEHEPKELPLRLLTLLGGGFIKRLMKEANDLVVNTASMGAIDTDYGNFVKEVYAFGTNAQVYHTNYFTRPEVANALVRWLQLKPAAPTAVNRGRSASLTSLDLPILPIYAPGALDVIPAAVDTDILLFNCNQMVSDLRAQVTRLTPSYVVVTRQYGNQNLNYAFKGEEVLSMASGQRDAPVLEAFNLHEGNASGVQDSSGQVLVQPGTAGFLPSEFRHLVVQGDSPIGVAAEPTKLMDAFELAATARLIAQPDDTSRILRRRTMPSFVHSPLGLESVNADISNQGDKNSVLQPVLSPCHIHAEMDAEVVIRKPATLIVTISREVINKAISPVSQGGIVNLESSKKLIITVIAKKNFTILDQSGGRAEIDLPEASAPTELYFTLKASEPGTGEVWVIARQDQVPLLKLILNPTAVAAQPAAPEKLVAEKTTPELKAFSKPIHQLWIEDSDTGAGIIYKYIIYSEGLKIKRNFVSKAVKGDRQAYVNGLYKKIEDRWISLGQDKKNFLQELRAYGNDLLDELIPPDLQQVLWERRNDFNSIQVISTEPFIPWELVHLKDPAKKGLSDEILFFGQLGLIRWLEGAGKDGWPPEEIKVRSGQTRYAIPHYPHPDYVLPEAEKEARFLIDEFGALPVEPESGAVRDLVSKPGQFDILHFACHGVAEINNIPDASLLMEGRVEGRNYIPDPFSATIARSFSNLEGENNAPMVVLNACQAGRAGYKLTGIGGFADAFLSAGAGAFIGTLWSVGDSPARTFTETMYKALKNGSNLSEATVSAREAAKACGEATWLAYVVYGHPHMKIKML